MNNSRAIDLSCAAAVLLFSLSLRSQLDGIPPEGAIFPLCVLYLLMGCGLLLAARALVSRAEEVTFFGESPPGLWLFIVAVYALQILGAMYVSFKLCMALGMLATLTALEARHCLKSFVFNLLFTLGFMAFFQLFFTGAMHIYFPEPLLE